MSIMDIDKKGYLRIVMIRAYQTCDRVQTEQ